jgi:prephenate dehydrogenase
MSNNLNLQTSFFQALRFFYEVNKTTIRRSYKDLTRVARLNPEMWSGLMTANKDKLKKELDEFISNLQKYSTALGSGSREELEILLKEGNDRKLSIDRRSKNNGN